MSREAGARVSPMVIDVLPLEPPEPLVVVAGAAPVVVLALPAVEPAVVAPDAVVVPTLGPLLSPPQAAATRARPSVATATDCFHLMGFLRGRGWTGTGHGRRATSRRWWRRGRPARSSPPPGPPRPPPGGGSAPPGWARRRSPPSSRARAADARWPGRRRSHRRTGC